MYTVTCTKVVLWRTHGCSSPRGLGSHVGKSLVAGARAFVLDLLTTIVDFCPPSCIMLAFCMTVGPCMIMHLHACGKSQLLYGAWCVSCWGALSWQRFLNLHGCGAANETEQREPVFPQCTALTYFDWPAASSKFKCCTGFVHRHSFPFH